MLPLENKDKAFDPIEEVKNKESCLKPSEAAQISGLSVLP